MGIKVYLALGLRGSMLAWKAQGNRSVVMEEGGDSLCGGGG